MPSMPPPVTNEMLEDCLQALHRFQSEGRPAEIAAVAAFARIDPATARQVLAELEARGLVANGQPERVALTAEGERLAAGVLRRHRLSERLFADLLGMPWDRVHDEAMRLEHALSPEAEARLARLLNHPRTCPHGGPIPAGAGPPPSGAARPLDRVPAGRRAWISRSSRRRPRSSATWPALACCRGRRSTWRRWRPWAARSWSGWGRRAMPSGATWPPTSWSARTDPRRNRSPRRGGGWAGGFAGVAGGASPDDGDSPAGGGAAPMCAHP